MAKPTSGKAEKEIAAVLARTHDEKLIRQFLQSILTRTELDEIASRWELVKLLDSGLSQRQIARRLGLSLCKITRGSRELKKKDSPFKRMIDAGRRRASPMRPKSGKGKI